MKCSFLFCILLMLGMPNAFTQPIDGITARVIDGDTFDLFTLQGRKRIRICGVDAPELKDPGGPMARRAMMALISFRRVHCIPVGEGTPCDGRSHPTSYNRIVAQCFVGSTDLSAEMVRLHQACDWIKFSGGHYSKNGGTICTK